MSAQAHHCDYPDADQQECWRYQEHRAEAAEKRVADLEAVLCSGRYTEDMPEVCPFFVEPSDEATPFGPCTGGCKLGRAVVMPGDNSKASPLLYKIGTIDEEQARMIWCHCYSDCQNVSPPNPHFVSCWRYWRAQFAAEKDAERLAKALRVASRSHYPDEAEKRNIANCPCADCHLLRAHEELKGKA